MKTWQRILTYSIVPLYILDYSITIYFVNFKKMGIESEGNPGIVFLWNHLGQAFTFLLLLTLLILGMTLIIKWWDKLSKTLRTITIIAIIMGIIIRVLAIIGWLKIGGIL